MTNKRIPEGYSCLKLHKSHLRSAGTGRDGKPSMRCAQCLDEKKKRYNEKYKDREKLKQYVRGRRHLLKIKTECFEAYGGPICVCCKEDHMAFLTLDHIENNGTEHRKAVAKEIEEKTGKILPYRTIAGITMYKILRDLGYPDGFQVLCSNCNHAKQNWPGGCPHGNC